MKSQEQYRNLIRFGFSFVIWGALTAIWAFFWMEYYAYAIALPFYRRGNWLVFAVYGLLLLFFTHFYGGYRIGYYKRADLAYSSVLALILCNVITYLQTCLVGGAIMSPYPFLVMTLLQTAIIFLWVMAAHAFYLRGFPPQQLLMIYGRKPLTHSLLYKMISYPENYIVRSAINFDENPEEVYAKIVDHKDGVILCDIPSMHRNRLLKFCFEHGIRTYTTPKISDIIMRGAEDINLFDTPLMLNNNLGLRLEQRFLKRFTDILFSGIALIFAAPFMLVIAAAIKICDRGPVIYKQKRLSIGGSEFDLYKFRSMIVDAEKQNGAQLSTVGDTRITPVGRVLRTLRLDELPQLWNIFKGDMSIVGPRPERPELTAQHLASIPEFAYRLRIKAGLTGLAQTVGRYNTTAYDKLKLDLMYITNYSLMQDFKIMLMTVKILFVKDRTEGVQQAAENPENFPANPSRKTPD